MGLQAKYDPAEDRMQLTLQPDGGPRLAFWVTRRQWLALLQALLAIPSTEKSPLPASGPGTSLPAERSNAIDPLGSERPMLLKGIRLRQHRGAVKLVLVLAENQSVSVDLPPASLIGLQAMLRQQAEKAGWDVEAGLQRLSSAEMTRIALRKARLH